MTRKKKRIPIPTDLAAQVLFLSDRTCCVCRTKGKPVQIHHIDEDPSNNLASNLSTLCFDCHRETQIRGGFDRKLDADQVILYRNDWLRIVGTDRAASEANRELRQDRDAIDIELITSIAEIYRETEQFELLAIHYNAIGNIELRDKYVEKAIKKGTSPDAIFFLRGSLQKRPDLVPAEIIDDHLAAFVGRDDYEQHARALRAVGRRVEAAQKYIQGINDSLQKANWFSAAFYIKEFMEENLIEDLFKAAYRKSTEQGETWWQVRALQELGWYTELNDLLLSKKDEIDKSGDLMLMELLAEAEGDLELAGTLRKKIAGSLSED
ncbi:HNH endonuclease signature motif containing protein [Pseudomonas syringae]|uniref:HNH endonuclease signature motif containing protein n=1 Tax=Pseudomonas syringae TaxID=317 RepID=UPI0018E5CD91|nr:HNH endonuclease signature motif containing protein [Pseudomonas syringae]MBI6780070.1 HNH endonuclease [Pseudomonas syringae]